ncbi:hypothetical protein H0H87_011872 [Tephrocybe sp. NHM501043]|nr:hypothetical protein H0H87_011872 [Tephrocybe sp. NHM501043]
MCRTIEEQHELRQLPPWPASENQLPCLEHICNLGTIDVMDHITKIKAIKTTSAIWDYSPGDNANCVLDGHLDVITMICTLSIKLQSSGQQIQYFESLQIECGIAKPLKLILRNNMQWGSVFKMLERTSLLQAVCRPLANTKQAINLFVVQADQLYGPIKMQQVDGHVTKKIPWTDFALNNVDWGQVKDAKAILADANQVLHYFSAEKQLTLWHVLPTIENLLTAWEDKLEQAIYALYHAAICDGLAKIIKYYTWFDLKLVYILALCELYGLFNLI